MIRQGECGLAATVHLNRHRSPLITSKWVSVSSGFKLLMTKNESVRLQQPIIAWQTLIDILK